MITFWLVLHLYNMAVVMPDTYFDIERCQAAGKAAIEQGGDGTTYLCIPSR